MNGKRVLNERWVNVEWLMIGIRWVVVNGGSIKNVNIVEMEV